MLRDEQGVVATRQRPHAEAVPPVHDRPLVSFPPGAFDRGHDPLRVRLGSAPLTEPPRDQDDALRLVVARDVFHDVRHLLRIDADDEEVHLRGERGDIGHAATAVDLVDPRLHDQDPLGLEALPQDVLQHDAAGIGSPRDADDPDGPRLQQPGDLGQGPRGGLRQGRLTEHHERVERDGPLPRPDQGVDLELEDVVGHRLFGEIEKSLDELPQVLERHDARLPTQPPRDGRRDRRALERSIDVLGGGEQRGQDRVAALRPQIAGEELGVHPPRSERHDGAEVGCPAHAHQELAAERGIVRHELRDQESLDRCGVEIAPERTHRLRDAPDVLVEEAHPADVALVHQGVGDDLQDDLRSFEDVEVQGRDVLFVLDDDVARHADPEGPHDAQALHLGEGGASFGAGLGEEIGDALG